MTPFLNSIKGVSRPSETAALKLLVLADEEGYVNLTWDEAQEVFGCTHKNMIRKRLGELKKAGICTGSTNCHVNVRMSCASERRENASNRLSCASERREFRLIGAMLFDSCASERRENASNRLSYASERRENASNRRVGGDYRGGTNYTHSLTQPLIESNLLKKEYLSELVSECQEITYAILTDDDVAMPHELAHAAALIIDPRRAIPITAKWLSDSTLDEQQTAVGLFVRLTKRNESGYQWRAPKPTPEFWGSAFAQRHGLANSQPQRAPDAGYSIPADLADIVIG